MTRVMRGQDLIDAGLRQGRCVVNGTLGGMVDGDPDDHPDSASSAVASHSSGMPPMPPLATRGRRTRGSGRMVSEAEFAGLLRSKLSGIRAAAVVGPGRSGAVASTYASHMLGIPFLPYGMRCPAHLRPLLIVDTARKSGATLRRAERAYGDGECIIVWVFDEPPRVRFWYEMTC
jgi:hypothetical protein